MKTFFALICFLLIFCTAAVSQSFKYYLNQDLASVDSASALFIGKGYKDSSLFLLNGFNKTTGKLFMSAHFRDSTLANMQGFFQSFDSLGQIKQSGNYENGYQQGEWSVWDSVGNKTFSILMIKGNAAMTTEYSYYKTGRLRSERMSDSTGVLKKFIMYDEKGNTVDGDKIFKQAEIKPVFPWSKDFGDYVQNNINTNTPSLNGAPNGRYFVWISFVVDTEGNVSNPVAESFEGYGMEEEAKRVIRNSPPWIPAMQNGFKVKFRMRQVVPFYVRRP